MRTIAYAFDLNTEMWWSRVGREWAIPVLDYGAMQPENNFTADSYLEKFPADSPGGFPVGTKKCPLWVKNFHRQFWGMRPLKFRSRDLLSMWSNEEPPLAYLEYAEARTLIKHAGVPLRGTTFWVERIVTRHFDGRKLRTFFIGWGLRIFTGRERPKGKRFTPLSIKERRPQ